jgi:hypothetical protein
MEDRIIELLKAGLPDSTPVGSLPLGMDDRKAMDIRRSAVWVVYVGSTAGANEVGRGLIQKEARTWSVLVLAKQYRSSRQAGCQALGLLESVCDLLTGAKVDAGELTKVRDQILRLPQGCGVMGYEAHFRLKTMLTRHI